MSTAVYKRLISEAQESRKLTKLASKVAKSDAPQLPQEIPTDIFVRSNFSINNAPNPDLYYFKTNDSFYLNLDNDEIVEPYYYISKLWSMGKGSGTKGVHEVVHKSLQDKDTMGRVFLDAERMDGKTSPAGFYYKLGFRFKDKSKNEILQNWLKHGGQKSTAPMETGLMYLPRENVLQCLTYGYKGKEKDFILQRYKELYGFQ